MRLKHEPGMVGPVCGVVPFRFPEDFALTTDEVVTCPECVKRLDLPRGLCADRGGHDPHVHHSQTLGRFWCTANQHDREPGRSERRRRRAS